ncbi:hypothetical protein ABT095_08120 [Kitasatospora sp. NPDC002227]|uniref:hypothetical protein n=1 Tax=Kitasatospora sp. NPDC002227 TaxID=3154773 RepID=UPI003325F52E
MVRRRRDRRRERVRPGAGGPGRERLRQPVALAVAASAADFAGLGRHGLFGGADFAGYLAQTDAQLRVLHGTGVDVHLRLLEPADFEDFCAEHQLDPGDPVARVAYAADPELAGEPFRYGGQPLAALLPELVDDHRARVRISLGCASLLESLGWEDEPQERLAGVLGYVSEVYLALAAGAGEGCHALSLRSVGLMDGETLTASAELCVAGGAAVSVGREAEAFCVTLAAAVAACGAGELLLRTRARAHGWALVDGYLRPMTVLETATVLAGAPGRPARAAAGFPLEAGGR